MFALLLYNSKNNLLFII